jgi:hypothetical protein
MFPKVMKADMDHKIEIAKALENSTNIVSPMKNSSIANRMIPKTVRGGGGLRSFFQGGESMSRSMDPNDSKDVSELGTGSAAVQVVKNSSPAVEISPSRNVFSRILGQK